MPKAERASPSGLELVGAIDAQRDVTTARL